MSSSRTATSPPTTSAPSPLPMRSSCGAHRTRAFSRARGSTSKPPQSSPPRNNLCCTAAPPPLAALLRGCGRSTAPGSRLRGGACGHEGDGVDLDLRVQQQARDLYGGAGGRVLRKELSAYAREHR